MLNIHKIKWIFFDMGYTLVNEDGAHRSRILCVLDDLRRGGKTVEEGAFNARMLELGCRSGISPYYTAARELGAAQLYRFYREIEAPFPSSANVLERLHLHYHLGIIASQPGGSVARLRKYGLLPHLDMVFSSAEIGLDKPDPAFFSSALKAAGCPPEQAVMVGDRLDNDIFPAKSTGMNTVRLRQGLCRLAVPEDEAHTPDVTLNSIAELPALFGC